MNQQSAEYLIGRVEQAENLVKELKARLENVLAVGKTLNVLRDEAYSNARAHGFHDEDIDRTIGDSLMLICTEVSEAFEAFRDGAKVGETRYECQNSKGDCGHDLDARCYPDDGMDACIHKPVGVPSEIADVLIRCFDFCGEHNINIERVVLEKMAYNKSRSFRHGNKVL